MLVTISGRPLPSLDTNFDDWTILYENCKGDSLILSNKVEKYWDSYAEFNYRYAIRTTNTEAETDKHYLVELLAIVEPSSFAERIKQEVIDATGGFDFTNIINYGYGVVLIDTFPFGNARSALLYASKIMGAVSSIGTRIGQFLNEHYNRLGTPKWNIIQHALGKLADMRLGIEYVENKSTDDFNLLEYLIMGA